MKKIKEAEGEGHQSCCSQESGTGSGIDCSANCRALIFNL